ncbi:uncharacterized protein AB675_7273 [Cyphellophora attinorum]|uniref:Protein kinase domain-containing protein n=1 Tax=Cyphellophora attinorum TaxID=1664694 RepID=A0A0N1NWM6_9EURO|nr:uncharacterized protein AB675_7273 [Phialophora attinorum]KPI36244.1 hypothetical protein AB675_7273 [Phialophora attinorum]
MQSQLPAAVPVRYGLYYAEGTGYFHVRELGKGIQGTAVLVRCAVTGELFVRKKRQLEYNAAQMNELVIADSICHPNVIKCVWSKQYRHPDTGATSSVTYWAFANHSDIKHLITEFIEAGHRVPEAIIWKFLAQVYPAMHQMHLQGYAHRDSHIGNIFVDWPESAFLPDFYIGDFGHAHAFEQGVVDSSYGKLDDHPQAGRAPVNAGIPHVGWMDGFNPTGMGKFLMSQTTPAFLTNIAHDFELLAHTLACLLRWEPGMDPDDDSDSSSSSQTIEELPTPLSPTPEEFYSPILQKTLEYLEVLPRYLLSDDIRTLPRYVALYRSIFEHCIHRPAVHYWHSGIQPDSTWSAMHAVQPSSFPLFNGVAMPTAAAGHEASKDAIMTFPTVQALEAAGGVPGPWQVGVIDARTGQLLYSDGNVRDMWEWTVRTREEIEEDEAIQRALDEEEDEAYQRALAEELGDDVEGYDAVDEEEDVLELAGEVELLADEARWPERYAESRISF